MLTKPMLWVVYLFSLLLIICAFLFNFQAMSEATFWFTTVVTVIILMIPVLAWRFYFVDVCPTLSDRVRLKQRLALLRYAESLVLSVDSTKLSWVGIREWQLWITHCPISDVSDALKCCTQLLPGIETKNNASCNRKSVHSRQLCSSCCNHLLNTLNRQLSGMYGESDVPGKWSCGLHEINS